MITLAAAILIIASIFIIFYLGGIALYTWHERQTAERRDLEAKRVRESDDSRQRLLEYVRSELRHMQEAVDQFSEYTDFQNGYFANYQLSVWKDRYAGIFKELSDQRVEDLGLEPQTLKTVAAFVEEFRNADAIRANYNKRFVEQELATYTHFFDTRVEEKKLDLQQRTAIVTDEDNNLVIAGAGTGKTTTILGKVYYVIDRYGADPREILLISFTNKSASDLARRIGISGIDVKTFHKFGKDVIEEVERQPPSIFEQEQFEPLIVRLFKESMQNPEYVARVTQFFTDFLKRPKSPFDFAHQGEYIQYIKDQNFATYKQKEVRVNGRTTYRMEVVKSIEECRIANFLFFNNIDYEYEFPYGLDTPTIEHRAYKPDFTVEQNGKKIYIEHLAVARDGNIPRWFADEGETYTAAKTRYWDKIRWARAMHRSHRTQLIETYSYEMSEGILFENLTQKLQQAGITLRPKPPEEIWRIITAAAEDEIEAFLTLLQTFITLMKSNNYSIADVRDRNAHTRDDFENKRNALFLEIVGPIFDCYQQHLATRKEIDFSDMINRSAQYIAEGRHSKSYRYVIIDEFQDISIGRYQLIKALRQRNPECKLFCVGDDWQSIYRFTGSDIALFRHFEEFFGFTVKSKIETTYRFHEPLIQLSSDFILKNPNQERKELRGTPGPKPTEYEIVYSENQDDTLALKQVFDELLARTPDLANKETLVLGRYNFDIDRIKDQGRAFRIDKRTGAICHYPGTQHSTHETIEARFLTIHRAKGLEADYVIVINCNSGKHGFPSQMPDDPVLNLLLSKADQFESGEERRLFYVAMTRSKEKVFFVADRVYKSKFILELESQNPTTATRKCPRCKTADLVKRSGATNGRPWAFYGCSNYMYGCDYVEWIN